MEKKFLLVGALLLAGGFSTMNADVIYVTESGSGDGTSWSSAASLEDALSWAAAGDEVFVAKGTYTGSFKLRAAAKVYGNCVGTETEPPTYTTAEGLETFLKGPEENGYFIWTERHRKFMDWIYLVEMHRRRPQESVVAVVSILMMEGQL